MLDSRLLEEPADTRSQDQQVAIRNLARVSLGIAMVMVLMATFEAKMTSPEKSQAGIAVGMCIAALLAYFLVRKNRIQQVSVLLVMAMLAAGSWSLYSYGSVRSSSSFAMVAAVVLAGAYLSRWAVIVTTLVSTFILGALSWMDTYGYLTRPDFEMNIRFVTATSLYIGLMGAMLFHTRRATDQAYSRRLSQMEDRLRLESERDQSLRRFGRIFHLNPTALLIQLASTQTVLEINPAFERCLGYEAEGIVGRPAGSLWASDLQWREHLRVLFEKGATGWQQGLWLRADGQAIDVWVYSEMSEDHSGMLIITTVAEWLPEIV